MRCHHLIEHICFWFLLRIWEVLCSNLGLDSYPYWVFFFWFSSSPTGECRDITLKLGHDHFQILSNSSFTYHRFILCYMVLVTEKALLNKLKINKCFCVLYCSVSLHHWRRYLTQLRVSCLTSRWLYSNCTLLGWQFLEKKKHVWTIDRIQPTHHFVDFNYIKFVLIITTWQRGQTVSMELQGLTGPLSSPLMIYE
jgi:hypothetical protein